MDKESGIPKPQDPQPPQLHLLALPFDLLIKHILSCLPIPTLLACSRTCKSLNNLISSSLLLTYLKELTIAGMLHNPLCTYMSYPISKRLEMLRERELRWLRLLPEWKTHVDLSARQIDTYHAVDIVPGHALFGTTKGGVDCAVTSFKLPNEPKDDVQWKEVADVGQHILNFGMALEEHNLIACLTRQNRNINSNFQVHLINHSTAEYHSSACVPVITINTPDLPLRGLCGDIAVCGENLVVAVKYSIPPSTSFIHRLYFWNWKSGILKAEIELELGYRGLGTPGLTFLREDVLLNPNTVLNSLDVYHIPYSPLVSGVSVRKVTQFNLPRLAKRFEQYFIDSHLCPAPRSSLVAHHIHTQKPFMNNPERSILELLFHVYKDRSWVNFSLLVRWQYLLARTLKHLMEINETTGTNIVHPTYSWEEWGPQNSRLISVPSFSPSVMKTAGCRWVSLTKNPDKSNNDARAHLFRKLEIYDFDEVRFRIAGQQAVTVDHEGRSIRVIRIKTEDDNENSNDTNPYSLVEVVDSNSPSIYGTSRGIFAEKVYTRLPYLRTTYADPGSGGGLFKMKRKKVAEWMKRRFHYRRDSASNLAEDIDAIVGRARGSSARPDLCRWDGVLVDDERIVGLIFEEEGQEGRCRDFEILYLG